MAEPVRRCDAGCQRLAVYWVMRSLDDEWYLCQWHTARSVYTLQSAGYSISEMPMPVVVKETVGG